MDASLRHVLNAQQFTRSQLEGFFADADQLREDLETSDKRREYSDELVDRVLCTIFFEPSTRTRTSFATAAEYLGMRVVGTENAKDSSSHTKGESLEDTIRILCQYQPAAIVLRHPETGAADRAAEVATAPIINAGDGTGDHPTQAALDIYTIQRELGRIDGLNVVIGGDLTNGRTARSLSRTLALFDGVSIVYVSPPELKIGNDIKAHLRKQGVSFAETDDLPGSLADADVVYWTRLQLERGADRKLAKKLRDSFTITPDSLALMKQEAIVMHPLPRVDEIDPAVDDDPRAAYFRQAGNGLFIRMAILDWVCRG